MQIKKYKHGAGDFWQRMGPFFASAEVQRELGVRMSSDEAHTWWVAVDEDAVAGFAAAEAQKNGIVVLRHAWIRPEYRENGIYEQLFDRRLADLKVEGHTHFRVTTKGTALQLIKRKGFTETGGRGSYTTLELITEETKEDN
jgi:N-acetylglutamate synthase-like GNAT family acetyltransferase